MRSKDEIMSAIQTTIEGCKELPLQQGKDAFDSAMAGLQVEILTDIRDVLYDLERGLGHADYVIRTREG